MVGKKLDEDFRSDVRTFAFFIGNGSLVPRDTDIDFFFYQEAINQPSSLLGDVFAVYVNTYQAHAQGTTTDDPQDRAAH